MNNLTQDQTNLIIQQLRSYQRDLEVSVQHNSDYDSLQEDEAELELVIKTISQICGG